MSLFGSLGIGVSGINANRRGLETVSHNIANADNPAYVRQQTINADRSPRNSGGLLVGRGTDTAQIRQIRDEFLDTKLRNEYTSRGYWRAREAVFNEVNSIVNEKGVIDDEVEGGFGKIMDNYWEAWNELAKDPSNMTARAVLNERAQAFVTTSNHMYRQLDELQKNLNENVKDLVDEVNQLTSSLVDMNKEVVAGSIGKEVPNDVKDARNQTLDRLAQIIDISYYEDERGAVNVTLNGIHIADAYSNKTIEYRDDGNYEFGMVDVYLEGEEDPMEIGDDLKSGELAAILESRGYGSEPSDGSSYYKEAIPTMKAQLDELVRTIAHHTNEAHKQGFDLNGDPGTAFFVAENGSEDIGDITARNIKLGFSGLDEIAAGDVAGQLGNGKNAEAIANLRTDNLYFETRELLRDPSKLETPDPTETKSYTMEEYYQNMILDFGIAGKESSDMGLFHEEVIEQAEMRRQSMSGVSIDEEMTDMLKFQHAYSANARFINAVDEMLDVIVNKLGA